MSGWFFTILPNVFTPISPNFSESFNVPLHGPHDGLAAAGMLSRHGKRHDLRPDPASAAGPAGIHQLEILPRGLQDAAARLAQHGLADRARLRLGAGVRRLRPL